MTRPGAASWTPCGSWCVSGPTRTPGTSGTAGLSIWPGTKATQTWWLLWKHCKTTNFEFCLIFIFIFWLLLLLGRAPEEAWRLHFTLSHWFVKILFVKDQFYFGRNPDRPEKYYLKQAFRVRRKINIWICVSNFHGNLYQQFHYSCSILYL